MLTGVKIGFDEAYEKTNANPNRIFTKNKGDGKSGFERINNGGFADIGFTPKFKLSKTDQFFTIGSCFARNIEMFLERSNVNVLTTKYLVPGDLYELAGLGARNGALNAYTPASMLQLINLVGREDKETCGAIQTDDDEFCDMLVTGIRPVNKEELSLVRSKLLGAYSELPKSDVVIITLGFTESWYDNEDKMFVNKSPAGSRKTIRHKDRFEFMNLGPVDTANTVEKIIADIRAKTESKAKIIVTVSPVPIHGTFTDWDVATANLYSKSTLVSAAVSVAAKYDYVDYYPSYEMVTFSNPEGTWENDGIHVKSSRVEQVVEKFLGAYLG